MSAPRFEEFGERLTKIRKSMGYNSRKSLAHELQIHPETLGGYERGETKPDFEFLAGYKQRFSVDLNWLLTGEGNMVLLTPEEHRAIGQDGDFISQAKKRDMIALPMFGGVQASAGSGALNSAQEVTSAIAFDPQYLRDLGASPNQCSVITAQGESMKPTIPDGALIVVDHSQVSVEHGCIYVFNVSGRLVVKRARWSMAGVLTLISDNPSPDYPAEEFSKETADQLNVVGRVVFHGRRA